MDGVADMLTSAVYKAGVRELSAIIRIFQLI